MPKLLVSEFVQADLSRLIIYVSCLLKELLQYYVTVCPCVIQSGKVCTFFTTVFGAEQDITKLLNTIDGWYRKIIPTTPVTPALDLW
jgi:hypothetical protein